MTEPSLFRWDQDPPTEWRERLAQLAPRNEQVPWLHLGWLSGEPTDPVQRWALWEITPRAVVFDLIERELSAKGIWNAKRKALDYLNVQQLSLPASVWAALNGLHPRTLGRWITVTRWTETNHYDETVWDSDCLVTKDQWEIHKQTDGWPQLYWIIQGTKGGHKLMFTTQEQRLLAMGGYAKPELPAPGTLPYAPFDDRVMTQLARRDKLRQWEGQFSGGFADRWRNQEHASDLYQAEKTLARQTSRKELQRWLTDQLEQVADQLASVIDVSDLPRGDGHYNRDIDAVERSFVEG